MVKMRTLRRVSVLAALMLAALAVVLPREGVPAAEKPVPKTEKGAPAAKKSSPLVAVIDIKGPIGPATSDYFSRAMEKAREMRATAIVVRMDTPGGLSTAMRAIIQDIITASAPVITYVTPPWDAGSSW